MTLRKLLTSTRLRARYLYSGERAHSFAQGLLRVADIIREIPPITGVVRDPNDDMVIACAVQAKAGHIVTRDKDLLSIGSSRDHYSGARTIPNDSAHRNRGLMNRSALMRGRGDRHAAFVARAFSARRTASGS